MKTQDDRMSRANGCWGTLWNGERLVASLTVPLYCCNYSNTSYCCKSVFLSRSVLSCMSILVRSLSFLSKRCSFRKGGLCKLVHCGRCLLGEGSNAYDGS